MLRGGVDGRVEELLTDVAAQAAGSSGGPGPSDEGGPEGAGGDLRELLLAYWGRAPLADLAERSPEELVGAARSHAELAAGREPGTTRVRALPAGSQWRGLHAVVEVVTDDVAHLVDSVLAELERQGLGVRAVVHPVLRPGEGADPVSWIHVEVDPVDEERLDAVVAGVRGVVADVRAAAADTGEVLGLLRAAADAMPAGAAAQEAARYLRWVADGNLVVLGARVLRPGAEPRGLGLLRPDRADAPGAAGGRPVDALPPALAAPLRDDEELRLALGDVRSRVARRDHVDHVVAALHDDSGERAGELRVIGLYAPGSSTQSLLTVPLLDRRAAEVLRLADVPADSHTGRDLLAVLDTFPREELRLAGVEELASTALAVLGLQNRRAPSAFLRADPWGRYVSVLVYMPRDRYTTAVRLRVSELLRRAFRAEQVEYYVWVASSVLSRIHFVVRAPEGEGGLADVDEARLVDDLARVVRTWEDDLAVALAAEVGQEAAGGRLRRWGAAFPEAYKEDFTAADAVADLARLERVEAGEADTVLHLRTPPDAGPDEHRLSLLRRSPLPLTSVLPVLANLGVEVLDERPYRLEPRAPGGAGARDGGSVTGDEGTPAVAGPLREAHLLDFGLRYTAGEWAREAPPGRPGELLEDAFWQAWRGSTESDGLDRLVLAAGLTWRQVSVLRAYVKYLRQAGLPFSQTYVERTLLAHTGIVRGLLELFAARFDPDLPAGAGGTSAGGPSAEELEETGVDPAALADDVTPARAVAAARVAARVRAALGEVDGLDADRTLRAVLSLVLATTRTNAYQRDPEVDGPEVDGRQVDGHGADGSTGGDDPERPGARDGRAALAFKLDPRLVPELPQPRPVHEIWVCSPRVEGVHLRFGDVARGGLRWSDRREDFRTEVLGLVRAQVVKNAVIVPTGAKGGFVAKRLLASSTTGAPAPEVGRDERAAEGRACYAAFVHGMLDVTDDLAPAEGGRRAVRPPERVVRHDADDPYLVVAADKGTATFSDLANAVAAEHGFWLGDAFASGGSVGYDHKAMGITARGAWVSVRRHFRELGHDVQAEPFTCVGVGDMSGDVFGNGMLLSTRARLVAAFDHRHVFLDPDPDPDRSWAERARLFRLPRSSWDDYDRSLLSEGGAVVPRTAKSVPITPQVRAVLGLPASTTAMTPPELIRAVLQAPVDLLWNGGIGTYVKASTETHADAGDKANDAIRVNGADLRCAVVGEGGNLGLTQRGRVEAALHGVALNTDAIDNSAGVDCSDHEVNIKVLLDQVVAAGDLDRAERDALLMEMTEDVGRLVLTDNDEQNTLLGDVRVLAPSLLPVHHRFVQRLERDGHLDRALEALPDDAGFAARADDGLGLTTPESSVLLALAKTTLSAEVLASDVPDEPWAQQMLRDYFPSALVERFGGRLEEHPLRRQVVTTCLVNDLVNRGGITFAFRSTEETGASSASVVRAYAVARAVFDASGVYAAIRAQDGRVPTAAQTRATQELRRLLDRAVRWYVHNRSGVLDVAAEVAAAEPVVARYRGRVGELLRGRERSRFDRQAASLVADGFPEPLAAHVAGLLDEYDLLDVARTASATGAPVDDVAAVHFALSERYGVDDLLGQIASLPREDRWQTLARGALRDDLYAALDTLVHAVLAHDAARRADDARGQDEARAPGAAAAGTAVERADARVEAWEAAHPGPLERARRVLDEVRRLERGDIAPLSVALRLLRGAVRSSSL
ncbi:NAD-glutamate dehydrogenase [uncultured Pseudokineococcus sp.]|uniref:NAD-glutamate dehydrogenase n=1 Tax=uncultured Pseudokineococcus sp. TaxID=1642928 RepID=UPI00260BDA47|nr:NAD-glutamate dehydrogenase [uncultured Pseudokineococcus sp.]